MAINTSQMRKIEKDWLSLLPEFETKGRAGDIAKRVGPLLIRMETPRGGRGDDNYKPTFSVHNLASPSEFLFISLEQQLPYPYKFIKIEEHVSCFKERVEMIMQLAPIPLLGPLTLDDIFKGYSNYMENAESYNKPFISQIEGPPLIAAWAGESIKAREYVEWADSMFKIWYEQERFGGDLWRPNLEKKLENLEQLRQIVREEIVKHKCEKVPYQNIVGAPYQV